MQDKNRVTSTIRRLLRLFILEKNHSPLFFHGFFCFLWRLTDFVPGYLGFASRAWIGRRRLKKLGKKPHIYTHNLFFDGRETEIGDYFASGTYNYFAGGPITIGDGVSLANYIIIETTGHYFDALSVPIRKQGTYRQRVTIGDNVWIGNRATIMGGVTVGNGSVIGAGSVVTKDVPKNSVVVGNPARVIRKRGVDSSKPESIANP